METTEMSLKYCLLNYGFKIDNNSKTPILIIQFWLFKIGFC